MALALALLLAEIFISRGTGGPGLILIRDVALGLVGAGFILLVYRMQRARVSAEAHAAESTRLAEELREQAQELEAQVAESESLVSEMGELNVRLTREMEVSHRAAVRAERLQQMLGLLLHRVTPVSVAGVIVDEGRRAVEAAAAVVVVRGDDGALEVLAAQGYSEAALSAGVSLMAAATPLGAALDTGEAVWLQSRAEAQRRFPHMFSVHTSRHAWAALPLRLDNRLLGALGFSFDDEGGFTDEDRAFISLLAQQCAQALDRARLHQLELAARVRAEFAERRLSLLSEASATLGASLDYRATLERVAWLAVPEIADWCVVHLVDERGEPHIAALAHVNEERVAARQALEQRHPSTRTSGAPYAAVLRTGQPVHLEQVSDDDVRRSSHDDAHYHALLELGLRSQIAVPIRADEAVVGVLTFANDESGRTFTDSDVTLALELGRRAGIAVHNARLYADAQRASDTKSDFLAVMSHELRTPLNAIIGYSDLLLLGVPESVTERAQRQVERIRGASTSLLHLVEEILSFSRIEAGKEELRISPVDVDAVVADCVAMVEPLASEKQLHARYTRPAQPVRVVSDERKIRQIVTNLLSNAVKFTEQGGFDVDVRVGAGVIEVIVSDTGVGIPMEHQEKIFEPFWQVDATATRRFGGTGLGLGVARKLAHLLEGDLVVQSEPAHGSRFVLTLPQHTPGVPR